MSPYRVPSIIKLYHITHVDNLPDIIREGGLWSDEDVRRRDLEVATIGMREIKRRRLEDLYVKCFFGDYVGAYVPFNFCPRSVMLCIFYYGNKPELTYRGGQGPIVHLQFDLQEVVNWANKNEIRWAFSLSNAGAPYSEFRNDLDALSEVNWAAVESTDFRDSDVKEAKQAEFLVKGFVPWSLVECVGTISDKVQRQAIRHIGPSDHRPPVELKRNWYF